MVNNITPALFLLRLLAVTISLAALRKRTTAGCATETARPAGWCVATTSPSMPLEKVRKCTGADFLC